jgi:tRNA modification GTPase
MILELDKDTIAAVSTAPGTGGIAVVRISGTQALAITKKLAGFMPADPESHRLYFGTIMDPRRGEPLDEVLAAYFKAGHSFTGEEVVEISCHGGHFLAQKIVEAANHQGARLARRGEFTYRAFMNGRIDLVQAEAILSLIESRSQQAARAALRQLKGALSKRLGTILDDVVWAAAHLEANIDFAQEDIEVAAVDSLLARLNGARATLADLLRAKDQSRFWREGFMVALVGRPNVGKSSLLNALLQEERAIVTDSPGTTRDLVEGSLELEGVRVSFIDTAGLRESGETVERIGIERARRAAGDADLVFFVLDHETTAAELLELAKVLEAGPDRVVAVRNKMDVSGAVALGEWRAELVTRLSSSGQDAAALWLENLPASGILEVSAKTHAGIDGIFDYLGRELKSHLVDDAPGAIHERHLELMSKTDEGLAKAVELLDQGSSPEFVAFELQVAVLSLHEILGRRFDDQVMDRVFGEFCLGK